MLNNSLMTYFTGDIVTGDHITYEMRFPSGTEATTGFQKETRGGLDVVMRLLLLLP